MTKQITATVEAQVNCSSIFEIWFRVDGALVGRGLITFNDRPTAERFLVQMLNDARLPASEPKPFITTTQGMSGWFAVMYWWNTKDIPGTGFWEPWDTGIGRYGEEARAITEAQDWAEAEGLEYVPRVKPTA